MVKPRFPGHVEAPSATRRATDKWAHDTMRPEQLDSGFTHTSQPQEGCALLHPLQGVSLLSTPLQGGILKPPALRVVVDSSSVRVKDGQMSLLKGLLHSPKKCKFDSYSLALPPQGDWALRQV